jgi:hypothetical protein
MIPVLDHVHLAGELMGANRVEEALQEIQRAADLAPRQRIVLQLKGAISADKAAELILKAQRKQKAIVYVPGKWRLIMFVIRCIPSFVFRKLSI